MKTIVNELKQHEQDLNIRSLADELQPLIKSTLEEDGIKEKRKGTLLQPVFLIWIILGCALCRDLSYPKVLEIFISPIRWLFLDFPNKIISEGSISKARISLGIDVMKRLFHKVVANFVDIKPDFHGMKSVSFDGTTGSMPDTKDNSETFKKASNQKELNGFPLMRIMTVMILKTKMILDVAFAPYKGKKTGESSLMIEILDRMKFDDIPYLFHFDALFYSVYLVHWLQNNGQFFLMKISKSIKLKPIRYLKDGSYLAYVIKKVVDPSRSSKGYKRYNKEKIIVRVIEFKIVGFLSVRLITNILDESISARELVIQYHQRWEIEIGYFEIKTVQCATLKGQPGTLFRSKRSDLVKQELYAVLIIYNMIRYKIWQAAEKKGIDPRLISFLDAKQWIMDASVQLFNVSSEEKQAILSYLLCIISTSIIDRPRRKRKNPRVIKQRSSSFPLKKAQQHGEIFDLDEDLEIIQGEKQLAIVETKAEKKQKNMDELFFEQVICFIEKLAA